MYFYSNYGCVIELRQSLTDAKNSDINSWIIRSIIAGSFRNGCKCKNCLYSLPMFQNVNLSSSVWRYLEMETCVETTFSTTTNVNFISQVILIIQNLEFCAPEVESKNIETFNFYRFSVYYFVLFPF